MIKPLEGIKVLDFSQFLSGPYASLFLADLGAEVIKVEKPGSGDLCRTLYNSNLRIGGESSLFLTINRNKNSVSLDLKSPESRKQVESLVGTADIVIQNFRPGVAERLGIGYEQLSAIKSDLIYGEITGYGADNPLKDMPGQDLLVQALSGFCWLNGNADQYPTPMGLSIVDMIAGQYLAQGLLSGLFRREKTKKGALIQVSLLESILDLQFEGFTTFLNDGLIQPERSRVNNANVYTNAPYGIYRTKNGYIAMAIIPIPPLGEYLGCKELKENYEDPSTWSDKRDEIKEILQKFLLNDTTEHWLSLLEPHDVWCSNVNTWKDLFAMDGFKARRLFQTVVQSNGTKLETTRCPISIDSMYLFSEKGAPEIGEHNNKYLKGEK